MEFLDILAGDSNVALSEIDFEWVEKCDSVTQLKSAISQLEKEYFPELLNACRTRLQQLTPDDNSAAIEAEKQQRRAHITSLVSECERQEVELKNQITNTSRDPSQSLPPVRSAASASSVVNPTVKTKSLTPAEHSLCYQRSKAAGNECYRALEFEAALSHYNRAAEHRNQAGLKDWTIETNQAITCVRLKRYKQALECSDAALNQDRTSWKARWRRAQALEGLCKYTEALNDYRLAVGACPESDRASIEKDSARCKKKSIECDGGSVQPSKASSKQTPAAKSVPMPQKPARRMKITEEDDDEDKEESKEQITQSFTTRSGFQVEVLDD